MKMINYLIELYENKNCMKINKINKFHRKQNWFFYKKKIVKIPLCNFSKFLENFDLHSLELKPNKNLIITPSISLF